MKNRNDLNEEGKNSSLFAAELNWIEFKSHFAWLFLHTNHTPPAQVLKFQALSCKSYQTHANCISCLSCDRQKSLEKFRDHVRENISFAFVSRDWSFLCKPFLPGFLFLLSLDLGWKSQLHHNFRLLLFFLSFHAAPPLLLFQALSCVVVSFVVKRHFKGGILFQRMIPAHILIQHHHRNLRALSLFKPNSTQQVRRQVHDYCNNKSESLACAFYSLTEEWVIHHFILCLFVAVEAVET